MKDHATSYENSYNAIQESLKREDEFQMLKNALPDATLKYVTSQKTRLENGKNGAISEKRVHVAVSYK